MTRYILALDQGTTSSRAILFDRQGRPCAQAQQELTQYYPQPGWVEHDAEEIWQSQLAVARAALAQAGVGAAAVDALGITNQRETTVLWDRGSGRALAPAIVWQDRRTATRCASLRADGHGARVQARTGLVLDPYFSATKLQWLLDHLPGARERALRGELAAGTVDSWLIYRLTGEHLTDPGNASRTLLFDLERLDWDEELLALFDIPRALLPQVVPSSGVCARTRAGCFGAPVAVAGIAGDQQAATFGQACLEPGMAKNTYGTGCFLLLNTGAAPVRSDTGLLSTVGWTLGTPLRAHTTYGLEGSVFAAGAAVQWLRDGLGIIGQAAEVEALAAQVPDSAGVVMVPAFAGMGAPHWDPLARGCLLGLTRGSTRAHIARATLEGIALQTADVVHAMEAGSGVALRELRVDGGASRNDLLMQMQADVLGVPVVRPQVTETTALGAAFLAGLASGFWEAPAALAGLWHEERRFLPAIGADARAARLARWQRAVARAGQWADPGPA